MKALIFDVDGTLAETEELHRAAFNRSFAAAGVGWEWDRPLYARLLEVTGGKERIRYFIDRFGGAPDLSSDEIAALHARKTKIYAELMTRGGLSLRPGVERLLREARGAGLKIAIATTTSLPNVEALLAATLGADGVSMFDAIAAGDAVAAKKPAPDVYLLALGLLGLGAKDCVAFEDTLNGVLSATAAGIPTVVTISAYGGAGPFPGALIAVDHLDRGEDGRPVELASIRRWLSAA